MLKLIIIGVLIWAVVTGLAKAISHSGDSYEKVTCDWVQTQYDNWQNGNASMQDYLDAQADCDKAQGK